MAVHDVTFTLPERALGKADAEFRVKRNGQVLGRLKISNGSIVWVSRDHTYGHRLDWVDFDAMMRERGTKEG
jgi:hypothetical protein